MGVYAENATFDAAGDAQRAAQIVRPEGAAQAVRRGVDVSDHLILVVERCHADNWSKDFFAPAAIGFGDVQQNSRFEKITFACETVSTKGKFASAFSGVSEIFFDRVALARIDEGAELCLRLGCITDEEFV